MKQYDDFRWIPCGQPAWNVDECLVNVVSAKNLPTPQYAMIVMLELTLLASSARIEQLGMLIGAEALPVIQIG